MKRQQQSMSEKMKMITNNVLFSEIVWFVYSFFFVGREMF